MLSVQAIVPIISDSEELEGSDVCEVGSGDTPRTLSLEDLQREGGVSAPLRIVVATMPLLGALVDLSPYFGVRYGCIDWTPETHVGAASGGRSAFQPAWGGTSFLVVVRVATQLFTCMLRIGSFLMMPLQAAASPRRIRYAIVVLGILMTRSLPQCNQLCV